MKKLTLLSFIGLIVFNTFSQMPNYVPTNGLFAWLPFTNNANDASTNNHNGSVFGAQLTTDRFGMTNSAYQFNGFQNIDLSAPFDFNERSISVWFSVDNQNSNGFKTIIGNDYPALNHGHSLLTVMNDDTLETRMGTAKCRINKPAINVWQHIVITRNATTTSFYSDGVLTCSAPNNNLASNNAISTMLRIGCTRNNSYYFYGKIDDVGLWTRALSACEVQDLYTSQLNSLTSSVSIVGTTMSAGIAGATYQWLDCDNNNMVIAGATNQTFSPPTNTGNYSVIVNLNGCVDTSICYNLQQVGIEEVYNTKAKELLKIVDVTGREIPYQTNTTLFFVYSNGTVEKKFILE